MLNIGICDDNEDTRMVLCAQIERQLDMGESEYSFFQFSSGEKLHSWISGNIGKLDILFLDIEMQGINGMETAGLIRKLHDDVIIVFVTSHTDYVFDGYKVGALDYLIKPVAKDKLRDVLTRALGQLEQKAPETYLIHNKSGLYHIPKNQILYFNSGKRQILLVTEKQRYSFYGKLDEVAEELGEGFVRIHKSYLIRAGAISFVEGNSVHIGDEALPISRSCRNEAMLSISKYIMGEKNRR